MSAVRPLLVALLAVVLVTPALGAQRADSVRSGVAPQRADSQRVATAPPAAQRSRQVPQDSLRPPISARRAFLYSFLLPGWGQSRLQRPFAGALFTTIEATLIALLTKTSADLRYARRHTADSVVAGFAYNNDGTLQLDPETGQPVVRYARNRLGEERIDAREQHVEDFIALIVGNHLFAGLEAFVSAQLWDLPARVGYRPLPGGGGAVGATIRW